jgi:serine protease Do
MRHKLIYKPICILLVSFLGFLGVSFAVSKYVIPPASTPVKIEANTTLLKEMSKAMEKLAESSAKGLVFISVTKTVMSPEAIDPFEFFFGPQAPMNPRRERKQHQEGFGSGFFIDLDKGYIMTNNHVVENAEKISLKLANGKTYEGKVVGHDKDTDVAVVQVVDKQFSREKLADLVLDDSDSVSIGSFVIAIGAPFLLEASVSFGIVSAVGRGNLKLTKMGNFIQTDAAINPGNSGGPLLNMDGKVIGVNSAIYSQTGAYAGIGFSIPSNIARRIATELINNGSFYKGYIGIGYEIINEQRANSLKLPKGVKNGIIIANVMPDSPAEKAGLEAWDVIVAVDGKDFEGDNLSSLIGLKEPGSSIRFTIYRQGKKLKDEVTVHVGTPPDSKRTGLASDDNARTKNGSDKKSQATPFGFSVSDIDNSLRSQCGITAKNGVVVVYVETFSSVRDRGVSECDVITGVNNKEIHTAKDFESNIKNLPTVSLLVNRKGTYHFAHLESEKK